MGREQTIPVAGATLAAHDGGPVGVIDIGSNSIRLVIYESAKRSPITIFNEKVLCAIGRRIGSTGALDQDGVERAREALTRFRVIATKRDVSRLIVVATAAVRDAHNGGAFVEEASALCGVPVRVLSGKEEAVLAAKGVLSGIPSADGLVGDLGGGSLELVELSKGQSGQASSVPLGPLRLMELGEAKLSLLRDRVDTELSTMPWLKNSAGKPFYAVGGVWRNLARIHMGQSNCPLHILQNYEIEADQALRLSKVVSGLSRKSLQSVPGISRRRLDTVPYGGLVLERLISFVGVKRVVISASGLREGLVFELLSSEERNRDPLIEASRALAVALSRNPSFGDELVPWIESTFAEEPESQKRLYRVAAHLSDTEWRTHPDYRAEHAMLDVKRAQFGGITHAERAFLALCVFYRYGGGDEDRSDAAPLHPIAGDEAAAKAYAVGCALRLAHTLSASASGILSHCPLKRNGRSLTLTLPRDLIGLAGESVRKRLAELADALNTEAIILEGP